MTHSFPGLAALSTFTLRTKRSRSLGASIDAAKRAYSREIDMQARLKTSRTASAGLGTDCFMGQVFRVVHGSHFSSSEPLNTTHQFGEALCTN
jgi:hypothetical protein